MKGKIEFRKDNKSKSGKEYISYKIDGEWYSDWNKSTAQAGDEVEFEYEEKGDFKNITSINVIGKEGSSPTTQSEQKFTDYTKVHLAAIESVNTAINTAEIPPEVKADLYKEITAMVNTQFIQRCKFDRFGRGN